MGRVVSSFSLVVLNVLIAALSFSMLNGCKKRNLADSRQFDRYGIEGAGINEQVVQSLDNLYNLERGGKQWTGSQAGDEDVNNFDLEQKVPAIDTYKANPRFILHGKDQSKPEANLINQLVVLQETNAPNDSSPSFWLSLEDISEPGTLLGQQMSIESLIWLIGYEPKANKIEYFLADGKTRVSKDAKTFIHKALLVVPPNVLEQTYQTAANASGEPKEKVKKRARTLGVGGFLQWLKDLPAFELPERGDLAVAEKGGPLRVTINFFDLRPGRFIYQREGTGYASDVYLPNSDDRETGYWATPLQNNIISKFAQRLTNGLIAPKYLEGFRLAQPVAGDPFSKDPSDFPDRIEGVNPFRLTKVKYGPGNMNLHITQRPKLRGTQLQWRLKAQLATKKPEALRAYLFVAAETLKAVTQFSLKGLCHNAVDARSIGIYESEDASELEVRLTNFGDTTTVGDKPRTRGKVYQDSPASIKREKCAYGNDLVSWALMVAKLGFLNDQQSHVHEVVHRQKGKVSKRYAAFVEAFSKDLRQAVAAITTEGTEEFKAAVGLEGLVESLILTSSTQAPHHQMLVTTDPKEEAFYLSEGWFVTAQKYAESLSSLFSSSSN